MRKLLFATSIVMFGGWKMRPARRNTRVEKEIGYSAEAYFEAVSTHLPSSGISTMKMRARGKAADRIQPSKKKNLQLQEKGDEVSSESHIGGELLTNR